MRRRGRYRRDRNARGGSCESTGAGRRGRYRRDRNARGGSCESTGAGRRGRYRRDRNARDGSCESTGAGRRRGYRRDRNARGGSSESTGAGRWLRITGAVTSAVLVLPGLGLASPAGAVKGAGPGANWAFQRRFSVASVLAASLGWL